MDMPRNHFKAALKAGERQIGLWTALRDSAGIEMLAACGYDWLLIDNEHAPITAPETLSLMQAAAPYPVSTVVRPGWNDQVEIKRLLDAGAQTILVPYVQTPEEAEAAVRAMHYPPRGVRGVAGATRASRYGAVTGYAQNASDEICLLVQVETADALELIARTDGAADRSASAIDTLRVSTPNGNVPLNLFVDRIPAPRVSQIERLDGKRVYYVRGNAKEQGAGAAIVEDVRNWIGQAGFSSDVEVRFEGADEDTKEANAFFGGAAMAALFMMAVILLWEFNNFWQVILTLSAVIISTSGVLVGIQLVLPYMSILMIGTGIVALAGIVVNNNIVLIDTYNRLRKDGRKAGRITMRAFRPFPSEEVRKLFKPSWKVAVIDRNYSQGHHGIFCEEIKSALYPLEERPEVFGFVAGLGGGDITSELLAEIWEETHEGRAEKNRPIWMEESR